MTTNKPRLNDPRSTNEAGEQYTSTTRLHGLTILLTSSQLMYLNVLADVEESGAISIYAWAIYEQRFLRTGGAFPLIDQKPRYSTDRSRDHGT